MEIFVLIGIGIGLYIWKFRSGQKSGGHALTPAPVGPLVKSIAQEAPQEFQASPRWQFSQLEARQVDRGLIVLDTETTGLDRNARVIEVAWVVTTVDLDVVTRGSLVLRGDGHGGSPSARAVHQISDAEICKAPEFCDVWPEISRLFEGRLLVAHNASFDRRMLNYELSRTGSGLVDRMACTMVLARQLGYADIGRPGPGFRSAKLEELSRRLNLGVQPTHRALKDAETAVELLRFLQLRHPAETRDYFAGFNS